MVFMIEKKTLSEIKGILREILNENRKQTKIIEKWMGQDKDYHEKAQEKALSKN